MAQQAEGLSGSAGAGRRGSAGRHVFVAIVGSGFSGLAVAAELKRAGIGDFVLLERASTLGGTWRDNHYPGCACDVPSHLYSFSFAPKHDWTRAFAPHDEIRAYLEQCADDLDLRRHILFDQQIVGATWDEGRALWRLRTRSGEELTANVLVMGIGALSNPAYPKLRGVERFRGAQFHSARWRHDYDLTGKRVAVIGTGASAIQFVPQIQPRVEKLYLIQRTPPWVLPKPDRAFSTWEKEAFRAVPGLRWLYRQSLYWRLEARVLAFVDHPALMRMVELEGKRHMARSIRDPKLRELLTPKYKPGCKRLLLSNDYYPALAQPNVEVLGDAVAEVSENAIELGSGRKLEVDAILYGTGFTVHDYLGGMRITGRDGVSLGDQWKDGAEAYLGTTVAGFPNLFMMTGPNTGLGHNSMIVMIEGQARLAGEAIGLLRDRNLASIEVRHEVQKDYNAWLQGRTAQAVWSSGCSSWYLDEAGKNTTLWPGFTAVFRARTARLRISDYELRAGSSQRTRKETQLDEQQTLR
ncbi:flavin-containing monooxygenase [Polyangium aurulentum]|uniref:flavin-containing monooxygenase n=1 Tax=Polyangium aurulentum TaxID=2567896 RepID=UPI0010AE898C|nr:NAD(P)/FAD-dependent oxidoreductase [Polyangium aurulentum]UQA57183.1 NAD(P)/FAD-dependent oxidoreductase [Polyangium aurulentum]